MKKSLKVVLFSISFFLIFMFSFLYQKIQVNANETENEFTVTNVTLNHEYLESSYLNYYGYNTNKENDTYIVSGTANAPYYGQNKPENALDGNFNTIWETKNVNTSNFINDYTIEFNQEVEINRLIFSTRRDSQATKGFPTKATMYISNDNVIYTKIGVGYADVSNNLLMYDFGQTYTCKYFRFEFTEMNSKLPLYANASEFVLFKPEEDILQQAREIFTDYKKSVLNSSIKSVSDVEKIMNDLKGNPIYETSLKADLERAIDILEGNITFDDANRQFSTDASDEGRHMKQIGDIDKFRSQVKAIFQGTNRQATGIYATPNQVVKIYVEANANDPLPQICFTQFISTYNGWRSYQKLNVGENTFTVPNLYNSNYANAIPGGALYLVNPYTEKEQSSNVKVYIEGGELFPLFNLGDNQDDFKENLANFVQKQSENPTSVLNICEIASENVILTLQATRANYFYNEQKLDINKVCNNWDSYIKAVHEFDGITTNPESKYYDERARYFNVNVRLMAPFGSAYAYYDHIGIQLGAWQDNALQGTSFGWGFTHEIGHMLDIAEREITEVTNNMVSQFNQAFLEKDGTRGNTDQFMNAYLSDDPASRKQYLDLELVTRSLVWWNIETMYNGYWATLENLYRYETAPSNLSKIEKHVYFSSLAAGVDLSYYFERIGFKVWGEFSYDSSSEAFKNAMNSLKAEGKIKTEEKKLWYFDNMSSTYNYEYGSSLAIYNTKMKFNPLNITKESNGYFIALPDFTKETGHLGFEIYENGKLIAFVRGTSYLDTTTYENGYSPKYQIVAYDQRLNATDMSDVYSFENQINVCRIGDTYYTSLNDAILAANDGDTIYLLNDIKESALIIDKNITIATDPSLKNDITFYKLSNNTIFTVSEGKTFKLLGNENSKIVVFGNNQSVTGRFIYTDGNLELDYIEANDIKVNINHGGFIYSRAVADIKISNSTFNNLSVNKEGAVIYLEKASTLTITASHFENNSAATGAILLNNGTVTIDKSTFIRNKATDGGVIYNKGTVKVTNSTFSENSATNGGVAYAYNSNFYSGYCFYFTDCVITNNKASNGGVIFTQHSAKYLLTNCTITENSATNGGVAFANQYGAFSFDVCDIYNNTATDGSIAYMNQSVYSKNCEFKLDNNIVEGSIQLKALHFVLLNGWSDKLKIQIDTAKGKGATIVNIKNAKFADNYLDYITLSSNIANKYKLILGSNGTSLILDSYFNLYLNVNNTQHIFKENIYFNDSFTMPEYTFNIDNYNFIAWEYNGKRYQPGDEFTVVVNEPIKAILEQYRFNLNISYNNQFVTSKDFYEHNTLINLSDLKAELNDNDIVAFLYNGTRYSLDDSITFDSSVLEITAIKVYAANIIVEDNTTNIKYEHGEVINLENLKETLNDNDIVAFLYNGTRYSLTDSITFNSSVLEITAIKVYIANIVVGYDILNKQYENYQMINLQNLKDELNNNNIIGFMYNDKRYSLTESIIFNPKVLTIVSLFKTNIIINDSELNLDFVHGQTINLEELKEQINNDNIGGFIYNGQRYDVTSSIVFDSNVLDIISLFKTNIVIDESSYTLNFAHGETINLQELKTELNNNNINGFIYNGRRLTLDDNIIFDSNDLSIVSLFKANIEVDDDNNINIDYAHGETINLQELKNTLNDNDIVAFSYNGTRYSLTDSISFDSSVSDIKAIKVYAANILVDDNTITIKYEHGEVINLENLKETLNDNDIVAFLYNGTRYSLTDSITFDSNVSEIKAIKKDISNETPNPENPTTSDDQTQQLPNNGNDSSNGNKTNNTVIYGLIGCGAIILVLSLGGVFIFIKKRN